MIVANIKDAERYCMLNPCFPAVFEFLKGMTKDSKEGIVGEDYRVNFSGQYICTADENADGTAKVFEAHKKYIDIHYCISGSEGIGYADVARLTPTTEYDEENDYFLLKGEYQKVVLREGDFCIVFPEDAHIPAMKGEGEDKLLKAVAKVKV